MNLRALRSRAPGGAGQARLSDLARWLTGRADAARRGRDRLDRGALPDLGVKGLAGPTASPPDGVPDLVARARAASA